ncbi:Beta-xylosidase [Acidisarcina polymorpha]|uniref:Beta-xylosidase n=1 Tax=Acidisarcina polymorpha TaxID=2211140 RepID=A0A2Z5G2K0_9BACT|nr:glycosyl hydrolase family 39 [Acidisarcina polymorpha]AXC12885.1 Beta-xylosidase [Acidisarcina polymorpha]
MRPRCLELILVLLGSFAGLTAAPAQSATETIAIDAQSPATPFPHFWEQMFGSGRAELTMRDSYRRDLREVKKITGFQYVRFHAILHDELGVYDEDAHGKPVYDFSYVDQIYDGLLANGVKPFVEISFMPKKLALRQDLHPFWYKQVVSPPKDYSKWDGLITAFAQHLIDRYGVDEVATWYFEVWNEPNIDFWTGRPAQQTYFELYDHTARALKAVNQKIRVGGPATAQAAWVDAIIAHATADKVPLDFVSTHVYGNDVSQDVFGDKRPIAPHQMVCAAVKKVHDQIQASAMPTIPLIWSEYNATYANESPITDSIYMGPWLADTIRQCDGMVNVMSYWTFSDVFEEQGPVKQPFYGGYGLIAAGGIPKPAFDAFELLHHLGDERLASTNSDLLITRHKDGSLTIALWNLVEPGKTAPDKSFHLDFRGLSPQAVAAISRVDSRHGDTLAAYKQMGSPQYPTRQQIEELRRAAEVGRPGTEKLDQGSLTVTVPASGLAVIDIR